MSAEPYVKMSLIERAAKTFDSFLNREFANRFYQNDFLHGLTERKLETMSKMQGFAGRTFLFACILAFFDLISGSNVSYGGLTVQITKDLTPIIALATAASMIGAIFAFIDDQIIFRILLTIGHKIHVHNFPLMLVDRLANNLWADAMVPRVFGEKSGKAQNIIFSAVGFLIIPVVAMMLFFPTFMVGRAFFDAVCTDGRWVAKFLATVALLLVLWGLLLVAIFSVTWRFYPADWIESTNIPTQAFIEKMQKELAAKENDENGTDRSVV